MQSAFKCNCQHPCTKGQQPSHELIRSSSGQMRMRMYVQAVRSPGEEEEEEEKDTEVTTGNVAKVLQVTR